MNPTFKAADRSDVEILLWLRRAFCRHEHLPFADGASRTALENLLADGSLGKVWLIHLGGAAAGYIVLTFGYSLEFDGRDAFVDELYVEEGYRGRGIGGLALRLAADTCQTMGIRALHLEVDRENHRARAVYGKAGFEDRNNHLLTKRLAPPTP
jgi:ribosomal protein S18 acetylase RimI-like enzyme